jgi:hypothetical protein
MLTLHGQILEHKATRLFVTAALAGFSFIAMARKAIPHREALVLRQGLIKPYDISASAGTVLARG